MRPFIAAPQAGVPDVDDPGQSAEEGSELGDLDPIEGEVTTTYFRNPLWPCTSDLELWIGLAKLTSVARVRRCKGLVANVRDTSHELAQNERVPSITWSEDEMAFELLVWVEIIEDSKDSFELWMPRSEVRGDGHSKREALQVFRLIFEERLHMGILQDILFADKEMAESFEPHPGSALAVASISIRFDEEMRREQGNVDLD